MSSLSGIDLGDALQGFKGIIDELKVTDEERQRLDLALVEAHHEREAKVLDYHARIAEAQRDAVVADAQSQSKLANSARPATLLAFVGLVLHNHLIYPYLAHWMDMPPMTLPSQIWPVIGTCIGGYIVARSSEKLLGRNGLKELMGGTAGARRDERRLFKIRAKQRRKMARVGFSEAAIERAMGEAA